ncbi:PREDICTED: kelch-like protein 18 isoform X2 [Acropora digitifera]|uniref:kelch-like protein 18 isoform X2 n=1 Tax=Acropora digitifera TaxID=70779 RepID=UPI00077AB11D|nr:PREDICTED: kelch-like protein 18 isoform X2 [Acropora digitifera]
MEELSQPLSSEPSTHVKHLLERVETQRRNDHFCDVTVLVKDKYFKAHKVLLTASSPFFRKLLSSGMKESNEDVIKIELDEATEDVMEDVLSYIYTGDVSITDKRAHNLIATADYLLLPGLKTLASNFTKKNLTPKNCIFNFYFAEKYDCKELKEKACEVVTSNFTVVMETEGFLRLQAKEVSDWISRDDIIIGAEEEVLNGIVKWVSYDRGEREAHFTELLRHIYLQSIPADFLLKEIVQEDLFSQNAEFALKFVLDAMKLKSQNSTNGQVPQNYRKCLETYKDGIFVCGGKKALAYFPIEDKWCKLRDAAVDYQSHCLVQWKDKIHIFHEDCNTEGESNAFREYYKPNIDSWGSIQSDHIKSINRCITFKGDLYVLRFEMFSEQKIYSYDAKTNGWNEVDPPSAVQNNPCVVASDQHLYLIGGLSEARQVLSRSKRFHPTHNTWEDTGKINEARHSAFGAAMKGHVYIAGGMTNRGNQVLSSCEMYSASSNEWPLIACLNSPRYNASMVCLEGKLYVLGGRCSSSNPIIHISRVLTIEELDSESRAWTVKSVVPVDKFETFEETKNKREYKAFFLKLSQKGD